MTPSGSLSRLREAKSPVNEPSAAFLADARRGSPSALTTLFQRYGSMVFRVACRITGSTDEADDVVQDVFVGLPEALRHYRGAGSLEAWIHRIATRTALMRLRRTRREVGDSELTDRLVDTRSAIAARLTLEAALRRLPESLRLVFVLKEMEGYSHAEIALLLNIRVGASEVRLHRAMKRLREALETSR
jgi:RNA polymerase sigma-70 factor, ECF subfamily